MTSAFRFELWVERVKMHTGLPIPEERCREDTGCGRPLKDLSRHPPSATSQDGQRACSGYADMAVNSNHDVIAPFADLQALRPW